MNRPDKSMVIPFVMVAAFFFGGLYLDYRISNIHIDVTTQGENAGDVAKVVGEHVKRQIDSLSTSSKLLYDFSKIALGVLLASFAKAGTSIPPDSDPKEGERKPKPSA